MTEYVGPAPSAPTDLVPKSYVDAAVATAVASAMANARPIGEITIWPGDSTPAGWVICNGQALARDMYPQLFSAIGIKYGAGDGSTTFNVPDYRGRTALGVATGSNIPATLGLTAVTGTAPALLNFPADFGLSTGTPVTFSITAGGTMPTGLVAGTTYFLDSSKGAVTQAALSSTLANSLAGTNIAVSTSYTGTITMSYNYAISSPLGTKLGEAYHRNTIAEMPAHTHVQNSHNHTQNSHSHTTPSHNHGANAGTNFVSQNGENGSANISTGGGGYALSLATLDAGVTVNAATATNIAATAVNQSTGGGSVTSNIPPSIAQLYLIRSGIAAA